MHSHSVETGHTCIMDRPGDKWNGLCINCSANFIFLTHDADLDSRKAVAQMLSECFDSLSDEYNFEEVDRMLLQAVQLSLSLRAGASDCDIQNVLQWITEWRIPERLIAGSDQLCNVMRRVLAQANRRNRSVGRTTRQEKCELWLHFGLLRRCLDVSPCILNSSSYIQEEALYDAAGGAEGLVHILRALLLRDRTESAVHNVLDFADVAAMLEGIAVITKLISGARIRIQSPPLQVPWLEQCLEVVESLVRELTCDYSNILREAASAWCMEGETATVTSTSLSMIGYRSHLLQMIAALVSTAEAQGWTAQMLESFTVQSASKHRLHNLVSSAIALLTVQLDNSAQSTSVDTVAGTVGTIGGDTVDYAVGVRCILCLLKLQAPKNNNSVSSLLLADDCNYSSKLFALYERCNNISAAAGHCAIAIASTALVHVRTLILEALHALAAACPARYFHYSLFSQRVRQGLVQQYLQAAQQLADHSATADIRPTLGHCRDTSMDNNSGVHAGTSAGTSVGRAAQHLQGVLLLAVQHSAVSGPALQELLQECAKLLAANHTTALPAAASSVAVPSMLNHVLPLLSAIASTVTTATPALPVTQTIVDPVYRTLQSAVLAALQLLSQAVQSMSDGTLRTLHVQTTTAVLYCMRCCCLLGNKLTCSEGDATAVEHGCAGLLSFATQVLAQEEGGTELMRVELFAGAVDLLQLPSVRDLCCKGFDSRHLHHRLAVYAALHCGGSDHTTANQVAYGRHLAALARRVGGYSISGSATPGSVLQIRSALDKLNMSAQSTVDPATAARHCIKALQPAAQEVDTDCFLDLNIRAPSPSPHSKLTVLEQSALFYLSSCLDNTGAALACFVSPAVRPVDAGEGAVSPGASVLLALALAQYSDPVHLCRCYPDAVRWALDCCSAVAITVPISAPLSAVLLTYTVLLLGDPAMADHMRAGKHSEVMFAYCEATDPHILQYYWSCCTIQHEQTEGAAHATATLLPLLLSRCTEVLASCSVHPPPLPLHTAEFVLAMVRATPIDAYTDIMAAALAELVGNGRWKEQRQEEELVLLRTQLVCAARLLTASHQRHLQGQQHPEGKLNSTTAGGADEAVRAVVVLGLELCHLLPGDVRQLLSSLALSQCTWLWCRDLQGHILHGEGYLVREFLSETDELNEWRNLAIQCLSIRGDNVLQQSELGTTGVLHHLLVMLSGSGDGGLGTSGTTARNATSVQMLRDELRRQLRRGAVADMLVAQTEQLFRDVTAVSGTLTKACATNANECSTVAVAELLDLIDRVSVFCACTLAAAWLLVLAQRDAGVPDSTGAATTAVANCADHDPLLRCWLIRVQELHLASDVALSTIPASLSALITLSPTHSALIVVTALRTQLLELQSCCALYCCATKQLQEARSVPDNAGALQPYRCQSWLLLMAHQQGDPQYSEQCTAVLSAAATIGGDMYKFTEALLGLVAERLIRVNENEVYLRYLYEVV